MAILLKFPQNLPYAVDSVTLEVISNEQLKNLYKELIIYYTEDINNSVSDFDYSGFCNKIKDSGLIKLADTLELLAEKDFLDSEPKDIKDELDKMIIDLKRGYFKTQLQDLENKIKQAEINNKTEEIERLSKESIKIIEQINILD